MSWQTVKMHPSRHVVTKFYAFVFGVLRILKYIFIFVVQKPRQIIEMCVFNPSFRVTKRDSCTCTVKVKINYKNMNPMIHRYKSSNSAHMLYTYMMGQVTRSKF